MSEEMAGLSGSGGLWRPFARRVALWRRRGFLGLRRAEFQMRAARRILVSDQPKSRFSLAYPASSRIIPPCPGFLDARVKLQRTPSPLEGEGWVGGCRDGHQCLQKSSSAPTTPLPPLPLKGGGRRG